MEDSFSCLNNMIEGEKLKVGIAGYGIVGEKRKKYIDQNGAMKVVKGSHKKGMFEHRTNKASNLVLDQEVSIDQIKQEHIVSLNLKAGEISLHNDGLLHGSDANNSERRRCGLL